MTEPLTDQQLTLRATLEAALRTAADQCTADCPAECRTHHPSIFASGMTAAGLAESIDGDIDAIAHVAAIAVQAEVTRLRAELEQARTALAEPILADWARGVTHTDTGTTVECVDADNRLRGIALELDAEHREALGLMLIDPDGEMDQGDAAGPLLIDRDDLTELSMILMAERYRLDKGDDTPVPQPRWGANVRISQAVNAALTNTAPACTCHAEAVHQAGCATT